MDTNFLEQHTTSKTLVVICRTAGHHILEVTIFIFSAMKTYLTYIYQLPLPTMALQDMTEHFIDYFPVYGVRFEVLLMVSVFWDAVL
jgi:hypothetical protein